MLCCDRMWVLQVLHVSKVVSSQACYAACLEQPGCSFWVWCNQHSGCDEGGMFDSAYAHQSCTLMRLPKVHMAPHTTPDACWAACKVWMRPMLPSHVPSSPHNIT